MRVWNVADGQCLLTFGPGLGNCTDLALSPDGHWVASVDGNSSAVCLRDAATGRREATLSASAQDRLHRIVFSPDGETLVAASFGGQLLRWDVRARTLSRRWHAHDGVAWKVAVSADGRTILSGGSDHLAKLPETVPSHQLRSW